MFFLLRDTRSYNFFPTTLCLRGEKHLVSARIEPRRVGITSRRYIDYTMASWAYNKASQANFSKVILWRCPKIDQ